MKTNSKKLALKLKLEGKSLTEIALLTGLSRPTIVKAYKEHQDKASFVAKKMGRPKLETQLIDAKLIEALTTSQRVFAYLDLKIFIEQFQKTTISDRSFSRLLQQLHWTPCQSRKFNGQSSVTKSCIHSIEDKQHLMHVLIASDQQKNQYLSFHSQRPRDANYLAITECLCAKHSGNLEIETDIYDLKYCPQLQGWQKKHPQIQMTAAHQNTPQASLAIKPIENMSIITPDKTNMIKKTQALSHLDLLEAESIHIFREVVAEAEKPVMLYSIGKDSAVMLHLAMKAFYPAKLPFPLLHVDTTWKFQEMYAFRAQIQKRYGFELLTHINQEGIAKGINPFTHGSQIHTDIMKTQGLKQALDQHGFDVAFGGARRDEEKSRAKERIFSFRSKEHRWDPKNQRPELWNLYNVKKNQGESIRVFPLSNWTELDIWQYIYLNDIPIVPLYFSQNRPVVNRGGTLIMVDDDRMPLANGEIPQMKRVRFRTLGCYPLTGAIESEASTLTEIIQEMLLTKTSERQGRVIDHDGAASMEKKKQEGYF